MSKSLAQEIVIAKQAVAENRKASRDLREANHQLRAAIAKRKPKKRS